MILVLWRVLKLSSKGGTALLGTDIDIFSQCTCRYARIFFDELGCLFSTSLALAARPNVEHTPLLEEFFNDKLPMYL